MSERNAWINARVATMDPAVSSPYGTLADHAIIVEDGLIQAVLLMERFDASSFAGAIHDVKGRWITPGLIDCHTHVVYGGNRVGEWEQRLCGVPYAEIAKLGGGILNTVRATRAMSEDELVAASRPRFAALVHEGVTCTEVKSGYGLTLSEEFKMLLAAKRLGREFHIDVSTTLLAAHAVPPEFKERPDAYVDLIVNEMIPRAADENLAEAVDAFCESIAFSGKRCERIWTAAKECGLAVKGHVEQLTNQHGAERLAKHGAWSADHLEYLDDAGVAALAVSSTVAVMLPGAYYFLREQRKPPVEKLRAAGVPMAVATDCNPGTSPFASIRLAMNLACVLYGMTPEECLAGATRYAAQALGRADCMGTIALGKRADFLVWDVEHPAEIVCSLGVNPLESRVVGGVAHANAS